MAIDHRRLGVGIAVAGLVMLLTLRFWASPIVGVITGRSRVGLIGFLLIPALLVVVGVGIVIALWGEELGLS